MSEEIDAMAGRALYIAHGGVVLQVSAHHLTTINPNWCHLNNQLN